MQASEHPLSAILPDTDYYEIDSHLVGSRFAVWVNYPRDYHRQKRSYPAVFMPDGNLVAPITMPINALSRIDPINSIQSVIQVAVGYAGDEAGDALRIRNRDLLPPGEPPHSTQLKALDKAVEAGIYAKDWVEGYKSLMHNGRADAYLSFLTDELFPAIAKRYRIDDANCGLFGYSYGGLFAAFAALQRTRVFMRVGAGSPGILTTDSVVLKMLVEQGAKQMEHHGRHLHMTICERELTAHSPYQLSANGFARFVTHIGSNPLPGLTFTSRIIPEESHASGLWPAWFSYLRTCYGGDFDRCSKLAGLKSQ